MNNIYNKMFLTKKYDQTNRDMYKSDNHTVGNANFFKGKIARLPEYYYDVLEAGSRREYTEDDKALVIQRAVDEKAYLQKKLIDEYAERELVVIDENTPIICKEINCVPKK